MKKYLLILFLFSFPLISYSQYDDNPCLAFGVHVGNMFGKAREEDGFERKSAVYTELDLAFNFNRRISIAFDFDITSTRTRDNQNSNFYSEDLKLMALGVRYSPLKTRLKIFAESQFFLTVSKTSAKPVPSEALGSFGGGINFGLGAKYSIVNELDAFLKAKVQQYFYTVTAGLNFNLPTPKTEK